MKDFNTPKKESIKEKKLKYNLNKKSQLISKEDL